jgi:hypothetical protein
MLYDEILASTLPSILAPISFCEETKSFVFTNDPEDPVPYSTIGESLNDSLNGSWNSSSNDNSDGTEAYNPNHQAEYWQEIKVIRKWAEKWEDKRNQAGYERNLVRWSHETAVALIPCVYQAYARGDSVGAPEEHHKDMLRSLKNGFTELEKYLRRVICILNESAVIRYLLRMISTDRTAFPKKLTIYRGV